jgi:hypothetical protein
MNARTVALGVTGAMTPLILTALCMPPAHSANEDPPGQTTQETAPRGSGEDNGQGETRSSQAGESGSSRSANSPDVPKPSSSTQGRATSVPDQNGKGPERDTNGIDKPGYAGGLDDDRDFNNGCGNDTDRDDDNEGWCGRQTEPLVVPTFFPGAVLGTSATRSETVQIAGTGTDRADPVGQVDPSVQLPLTGFDLQGVAEAAATALLMGVAFSGVAAARRHRTRMA